MAKYKIGIIGYGKIAQDQHVPAIRGVADFELVAVSTSAKDAVPADGAKLFADPMELLKLPELDAVAICTPPAPRRTLAAACLSAGKHVLLEKPPAGTVSEVDDIARRAAAAGKVAFATYHAQHNKGVQKAGEALAGKTLKTLEVIWKEDVRQWHPGQDWILEAGGLGVFDPGINAMSVLLRCLPARVFVSRAEMFFPSNRQAPIAANLSFTTGTDTDGALTCELDWRQSGPPTWQVSVETTDGFNLVLKDGGARLEIPGQAPFVGPPDEYPDIYREFLGLLDRGESKVDAAPYQLLADAFMVGRRTQVEPFAF